jgi:hypothetical protein
MSKYESNICQAYGSCWCVPYLEREELETVSQEK